MCRYTDMLTLYDYPASGNCYKARLALAQLEREYEKVTVDIFDGDTLTDEYERLNPARETPVLITESGAPLPESNAILLYLAEGTALLPDDLERRAHVYRWLFFERSHFAPGVAAGRFYKLTGRAERHPKAFASMMDRGRNALRMLDGALADRPFVAGDAYTVADISLYAYGHVAHEAGFDMSGYPRVTAWLERVAATPRAMHDLEPYPENASLLRGKSTYG
jgi:glutathione S-transferase